MIWLSLLVSVAFVPGWTGAAIPTNWVAMSFVLPWMVWKGVKMTPFHWLGLAFLGYAFASVAWAPDRFDAVWELWHWTMFGLCFVLGAQTKDLRGFWKGLAIGCGVSSAIAVVQWWGGADWQIIPTANWGKPPGLFFNDAVAGAVAAMTLVGLATELMWAWALLPLPLLLLSHSRGAWVAVLGTYAWMIFNGLYGWTRWVYVCLLLIPATVAIYYYHGPSDGIRLEIWQAMATHLVPFGHGVGSSLSLYTVISNQLFHIEHAHNDYLNLAYEFGLGAIPLTILAWLLVENREATSWPPFACGLILCLYYWTLESPVTGFVFCVVAGRVAGDLDMAWAHGRGWGLGFVLRDGARRLRAYAQSRKVVSFQLGS